MIDASNLAAVAEKIADARTSHVEVHVTTKATAFRAIHRLDRSQTVQALKDRFLMVCGINPGSQVIDVFNTGDKLVCRLDDLSRIVGSYEIENQYRLHVTNNDPSGAAAGFAGITDFTNTDGVEKFEISDAEYDKKRDSVRAIMKARKEGKYDLEGQKRKNELAEAKAAQEKRIQEAALEKCTVGSRCKVAATKNAPERKGVLRFTGTTDFSAGIWGGVELDEPYGKNDGSCQGKQYFKCEKSGSKYGVFVKIQNVECGDFGAESDGLDLSDLDEL